MVNKKKDQSILISGESGAGKTFTVRVCMKYVSEIAGSPLGVEKKVRRCDGHTAPYSRACVTTMRRRCTSTRLFV